MTHSIISLGQRAALSALLLRASCPKWTARPAFSVGHFDPLISLRVESGCPLGNLIFNDLEALQVESSGHFDHLIFTEWGGDVLQKNRSFQNDNSGGFVTAKIKLRKAELDFRGQPKFPLWGFGSERLGVTVFWYFPKWEAPLYRIEAAFTLRWR